MKLRPFSILILLLLVTIPGISACAGPAGTAQEKLTESALPDFVQDAPPQVKEAYRFAIANPEVLSDFPCYCGCGAMGHQNNLQCYIKEVRSDGSIEFENHAFG
jgi:hypothetical protein